MFIEENKDRIEARISTMTNALKGTREWIGQYQNCVTALMNEEGEQGMLAYEDRAKEWNAEGPPAHVKARYVHIPRV